ncbi:MAG: hypothetical protein ACTHU0_02135, partial [Kofleriaceae bacterium]
MSADKLITFLGILGKLEPSYGAGATVAAASDGHQLAELPEFTPEWANDGTRVAPPGTAGYQRKVAPTGRNGSIPLKFEAKGAGAPYSSTVVPQAHPFLRAAGLDAAARPQVVALRRRTRLAAAAMVVVAAPGAVRDRPRLAR